MAYTPIENYGIIGDMRTCALVGMDGSIDWLCLPHFDSPSVFCALLDDEKGGRFQITSTCECKCRQLYLPDTNILMTRFLSEEGVAEVIDFMPVQEGPGPHASQIVRIVKGIRGQVPMRMLCRPAFNYARNPHTLETRGEGALFRQRGGEMGLALTASLDLQKEGPAACREFTLREEETHHFILWQIGPSASREPACPVSDPQRAFDRTSRFWRGWLSHCTYYGRWREQVQRSAMILKLLTFEPTGAIVAAATTSLPETIGGTRNWDYRYTWIRDAAFTIYALMRIGFTAEAEAFMKWVQNRSKEMESDGGPLQLMYSVDGRHQLEEEELPHLKGYKNSRPVRIGNAAYNQLQLDIYGALIDSVYIFNKHKPISYDFWINLRKIVSWVCDNWRREDHGIWEFRGGRRHFVFSRLMCWVALDRGLRLADKRSFPAPREHWLQVRDEIYEEIMSKGWNRERQAFVQSYGSSSLDASNLILPLTFFIAPSDPRMQSTLEAITKDLLKDSLLFRYEVKEGVPDNLGEAEGTFSICTFWLVEALARSGRIEEARLIFEKMLGYANHLGLYSEEISIGGDALGNTPQAFTHLSMISAAFNLDRALGK
ncbi:MAG: glycoside hydrolase family 15 protein [Candidatus Tectomicrobia bacterium]|nr:glycoside hydrolase family 15 protein [Candidatus Tectomicrobia bacterium]